MPPQTLSRRVIYASRWVNLYVDRVQFPNGTVIDEHHLLEFDHRAVMAVASDTRERFVMVKVCRYPTGRTEWEFPAGRMEPGEGIIEAARREALEETGCQTAGHEVIYEYNPMNGIANQVFYVVRCTVTANTGEYDHDEISEVGWFTEAQIGAMIRSGQIKDGYTLTAFFLYNHLCKS